jgi:hypothetical protein
MKSKTWPPNWKNRGEYPHPDKTSMEQWAWEFLRRNLDYQKDYEEYRKNPKDFPYDTSSDPQHPKVFEEHEKNRIDSLQKSPKPEHLKAFEEYEKNPEDSLNDSYLKFLNLYYDERKSRYTLAYRWGIVTMVDPSEPDPLNAVFSGKVDEDLYPPGSKDNMITPGKPHPQDSIFLEKPGVVLYPPKHSDYEDYEEDKGEEDENIFTEEWSLSLSGRLGEVPVVFDLKRPLPQQLDLAKITLKELKNKWEEELGLEALSISTHPHLYTDYLRVLDAQEAGAKYTEMASTIYLRDENFDINDDAIAENLETVNNHLRKAKKLMNFIYKDLPLRS